MRETPLSGRWLLLVEEEPIHAVQLQQALEEAGASVTVARCAAAKFLVERPELSTIVLDCHPNWGIAETWFKVQRRAAYPFCSLETLSQTLR